MADTRRAAAKEKTMRPTDTRPHRLDWVVVANAARARCFERDADNGAMREIAAFVHPASRIEGRALSDDRAGHAYKGAASTQFQPRTDAPTKEHVRFARVIADFVEDGARAHRFEQLAMFASDPFLGVLRARLGHAARGHVHTSRPLDLTLYGDGELELRVREALADRRASSTVPRPAER
jgi:hypothetical protein